MRRIDFATLLALTLITGCVTSTPQNTTPPPVPKLPNYGGMAEQVVSWLPEGAQVTLAYMDLTHVESVQGREATKTIRQTYPDRMDVYLANAARFLQPTKKITVVDRRNMTHFLTEQKLQASDMVPFDPASRVKLKKITAVNTYVYWKIVREGDIEEWVLRAVAVETGEVYGGLVHRFRVPDELKVQPRIGDLTVDAFDHTSGSEQFRLALQGRPAAMVEVGEAIERGNVRKSHLFDPETWYAKAGEAGHAEGFYRIGKLYSGGSVPHPQVKKVQNWIKARAWFEKAAELGHIKAHTQLGIMHKLGHGTTIEATKARTYFLTAARGGDALAMCWLGYLFESGKGGEADLKAAVHWYQEAAKNGSGEAARNLGHLYAAGRGVKQDDVAAVRWYRKAALANFVPSLIALGLMYENGRGVPKSLEAAQDLFRRARRSGSQDALDHVARVSRAIQAQFAAVKRAKAEADAKRQRAAAEAKQRTYRARAERRRAENLRLVETRKHPWRVIAHSVKFFRNTRYMTVIRTLKKGATVHVLTTGSQYWKVRYLTDEGYVRAGMLEQIKPETEPKTPTVKASDKKGSF